MLHQNATMQRLAQLHGLLCRDFRLIAGGGLILYIGERANDKSLTEWRLHLEPAWRLEGPDGPLTGSFDYGENGRPLDCAFEALRGLAGKAVESVNLGSPVLDLRIEFAGSFRLLSFAHSVADGENWEFRHRSGLRVAMRAVTECVEYTEEPDCEQPGNSD
jgi:hypothetical protein